MALFSPCRNSECPIRLTCYRYRQKFQAASNQTYVLGIYGEDGCEAFLPLEPGDNLEDIDEEDHQGGIPEEVRAENPAESETGEIKASSP